MRLHTDIPTRGQVSRLFGTFHDAAVSIYLPTDPASNGRAERIALKNLVTEAVRQLQEAGAKKSDIDDLKDQFEDLMADDPYWVYQARTLAIFATPEWMVTFRLPNRIKEMVAVSDRFHLKPLLRAITFPQVALILALTQKSARVLEILPEGGPETVELPDLPQGVVEAAPIAHVDDGFPKGKTQGSMAEKSHLRIYCRAVDTAIKPHLAGRDVPLILAATEPLQSIYRSVNTYPHLTDDVISGNPKTMSDGELAARAREILDRLYAAELKALRETFDERAKDGRALIDITDIAHAATLGMVETLIFDMDAVIPGLVGDDGSVELAGVDDAVAYAVVDEVARRVWYHRGRVLAVRREDVPGGGDAAAILRFTYA